MASLHIGFGAENIRTVAEAAARYVTLREASRRNGFTDWPDGLIKQPNGPTYWISTNGRVWVGTKYKPGQPEIRQGSPEWDAALNV